MIEDTLRKEACRQDSVAASMVLNAAADTITTLRASLDAAHKRLEKLDKLERAGVDNWQGYDDAMSDGEDLEFEDEEDEE